MDIGKDTRTITFEPIPDAEPFVEPMAPAPEPVEVPERELEPA